MIPFKKIPSVPAAPNEGPLEFEPGQNIVTKGEAGGDLFLIKEGNVEVYTQQDGHDVVLAQMNAGEIIGIMTCLTNAPRMASARAMTKVLTSKIEYKQVMKLVKDLPKWLQIILKEFTLRLGNMDLAYGEAVAKIRKLETTQVSRLYTAQQLAGAISVLAPDIAIKVDDQKVVVTQDLLNKIEGVLCRPKAELENLFEVFMMAGVVRQEIEPDKKRTVMPLEVATGLTAFVQFINESRTGPKKKLIKTVIPGKDRKALLAICKFAATKSKANEIVRVSIDDLKSQLKAKTGEEFDENGLICGLNLGLLQIEGQGEQQVVALGPSSTARTLAWIRAVQKLRGLGD